MKKAQENNFKIVKQKENRYYSNINMRITADKRLSLRAKYTHLVLQSLDANFKITHRATSQFLGISQESFNKILQELVNFGYLEIIKEGKGARYILKETSTKTDFNPRYIKNYTIEQLNAYYNDNKTSAKYKNLIKKALSDAVIDATQFYNTLKKIENFEPSITYKDNQEIENEQETESDFMPFDY